jgi:hypothetical protein
MTETHGVPGSRPGSVGGRINIAVATYQWLSYVTLATTVDNFYTN